MWSLTSAEESRATWNRPWSYRPEPQIVGKISAGYLILYAVVMHCFVMSFFFLPLCALTRTDFFSMCDTCPKAMGKTTPSYWDFFWPCTADGFACPCYLKSSMTIVLYHFLCIFGALCLWKQKHDVAILDKCWENETELASLFCW